MFYFCNVFLVELILWKKRVSGFVCLYRPFIPLLWAKFPEPARKWSQTCSASWVLTPSPRDLSRFAQPSSRASAWKPISPLLAVGGRTLPSYGKVFNTNLMVCLATVHPELSLLPLHPLAQSMETSLLITFSKTPPNFLPSVSTAFLTRACPNSLFNPAEGNGSYKLK